MSTGYLNYITLAGLDEEALAKEEGRKVTIEKVVIGLGLLPENEQPQNQTALLQPKAEAVCFVKAIDTEHGFYRVEADIPIPDTGYNYFEIGTLTDTGVLYSYARSRGDYVAGTADSDGKLTRIRLNFRTDNSELITITQDDSVLFTPITDFEAHVVEFNAHCQADNPHTQYLHNNEHATQAQAEAGVSAAHWMSPLRWMQAFKSRLSNSFTGTRTDYAASELALSSHFHTPDDIGAASGKVWDAIIGKGKWSRVAKLSTKNVNAFYGGSFEITVATHRSSFTQFDSFSCVFGYGSLKGHIISSGPSGLAPLKVRLLVNSGSYAYFEVYGTEGGGDFVETSYGISIKHGSELSVTSLTSFTDGTELPDGYSVASEMETTSNTISYDKHKVHHTGFLPSPSELGVLSESDSDNRYTHKEHAQCSLYDKETIYEFGDICFTREPVSGEALYWQWYSNVESLAGKDPLSLVNRRGGWNNQEKPWYWVPFLGKRAGEPIAWDDNNLPEEMVTGHGQQLSIVLYHRLAKAKPHWIDIDNNQLINIPNITGRFMRAADNNAYIAGEKHDDAIRDITGAINGRFNGASGAFKDLGGFASNMAVGSGGSERYDFKASRVVPTAAQNQPMGYIRNEGYIL